MATNTSFQLTNASYVAFDATSLKNLIIDRLNNTGVFTDQNYEGSNINQIIEIISYSYHTLLFYLNQTSTESNYSQASLYENINKIVKLLNYNPIGCQTATLNFNAVAPSSLATGTYTIPRYSSFIIDGVSYTFNEDTTFTKTLTSDEALTTFSDSSLLYQGTYVEYPSYLATGEPYEQLTITALDRNGNNIPIDHFNIDVYVKDNTQATPTYALYKPVDTLFLEKYDSLSYEIRLNENGRYVIKFGNNTFGKQLNVNDEIAIYYLQTDGVQGQVGIGSINQRVLSFYNSTRYQAILANTLPSNYTVITPSQAALLQFTNNSASTQFQDVESVDSIRTNALNTFKTQYRLTTTADIASYIIKNFSNIISSTQVVNNKEYIEGHLKYYFDIGVEKPSMTSRLMLNQVKFSSSCNFNNIYVYAVPRIEQVTSLTTRVNYLNTTQKQYMIDKLSPYKVSTSEIVVTDPVYVEIGFGVSNVGEALSPTIADESVLQIIADGTFRANFSYIQSQVASIFTEYFATTNNNLGVLINLADLSSQILAINGVQNFNTIRQSSNFTLTYPGISLLAFNPVYSDTDIAIVRQNLQLPYFKFPYLGNSVNFTNKIVVVAA